MASMSDGIQFSCIKPPSLIKQLKSILSDYPDGGQILKELIQNAEDAEAKVVKIVYDERRINEREDPNHPFTKFFKGPALCIYNDAVFQEDDWKGIQMIYSSIKEKDPLKVGRFGLGFKSVFHITDYPSVISGSKMLMIDPLQPAGKETAMIDISFIDSLDKSGFNPQQFWEAFENMCNFDRGCAKTGYFGATLFRFPLREKATELSETLYDKEKIMELFEVFCKEASSVLLFLKNLECISVGIFDVRKQVTEKMSVRIVDATGYVRIKRNDFREKIKGASQNHCGPDISSSLRLSINITDQEKSETADWQVVEYFARERLTTNFSSLIEDSSLGYSPYVGIATQLATESMDLKGHIFCFLPLPREGHSLTDLPVHVNGFFALSQNRHHLKWETDEQKGKKLDDKSILWNKCLISEAIPRAYKRLIESLVDLSNEGGNSLDTVGTVYRALPKTLEEENRWHVVVNEVYQLLKDFPFLFCRVTNNWITIQEACFVTFKEIKGNNNQRKAILNCLETVSRKYIETSLEFFSIMKEHFPDIQDLTANQLVEYMHLDDRYKLMEDLDKQNLFSYLLLHGDLTRLVGLELLRNELGQWICFDRKKEPIFLSAGNVVRLLRGLEDRFLSVTIQDAIQEENPVRFQQLCETELTQLKQMTVTDLPLLLNIFFERHFSTFTDCHTSPDSHISIEWLRSFWQYIRDVGAMSDVTHLPIVPVFLAEPLNMQQTVALKSLKDNLIVKNHKNRTLPDDVCKCLEKIGATVIESVPDWIPKEIVESFFVWPNTESVIDFLSKLGGNINASDVVNSFNQNCNESQRKEFVAYLSSGNLEYLKQQMDAVKLLKNLCMFRKAESKNDFGKLGSVYETRRFILETVDFPKNTPYPFPCLVVGPETELLIKFIGGEKISRNELLLETLKACETDKLNISIISEVMDFVIEHFETFKHNIEIVNTCRNIKFLRVDNTQCRYKADDLFDPSDSLLKSLLYCEGLLPATDSKCGLREIEVLRMLGMKTIDDVDGNIVHTVAQTLSSATIDASQKNEFQNKCQSFMDILKTRPELLCEPLTDGNTLKVKLNTLSCIPVLSRPDSFPNCLKWYENATPLCKPCEAKEQSRQLLVGSVIPLVKNDSEQLTKAFCWDTNPELNAVLGQLRHIQKTFTVHNRPELLQSIIVAYKHLNERIQEIEKIRDKVIKEKIVCTGEVFVEPDIVIINRDEVPIDLRPHFYYLPEEYILMKSFFNTLGCRSLLDREVLENVLQKIKIYHQQERQVHETKRDKDIVCKVLANLAECHDIKNGVITTDAILILVHDENPNTVKLLPISECAFDDDPTCFFDDDGTVNLVHSMVDHGIVEALGVKSLSRRTALGAEDFGAAEWGQKEHLTTRLNTLLKYDYTDGLSVPKELIQNADDAGASTVKFLYDRRENAECRERVLSKDLKEFQGPAMWMYNDSTFSQEDLQNITKLNGGTKQFDCQKIGKFGLGFCAVYNLTDLPSFVSGQHVVFFDPHETHIGNLVKSGGTGLKYKLPNKQLLSRFADQFKVFHGVFDCNILDPQFEQYNGTLFRLPLRTELQARESKIYKKSYSHDQVLKLLDMFVRAAANFLLFTQNVKTIEIFYMSDSVSDGTKPTLLYKVQKEILRYTDSDWCPLNVSVLSRVPSLLNDETDFFELHKNIFCQHFDPATKEIIPTLYDFEQQSKTVWIVSWAKGQGKALDVHRSLSSEGSIPFASVACLCTGLSSLTTESINNAPSGFYSQGHLFCFLPLPIKSGMQVHLNGCFAVSTDRRRLDALTEDDKSSYRDNWNNILMEDAAVCAMVFLLESLSSCDSTELDSKNYYHLWPRRCSEAVVASFKNGFYKRILCKDAKVFRGTRNWLSFSNVTFLDPIFRQSNLGNIAFEYIDYLQLKDCKHIVDLPDDILEEIEKNNPEFKDCIDNARITYSKFYTLFLGRLDDKFWEGRQADRNLLIAKAVIYQDETVQNAVRQTSCIPTDPNQTLRKPNELVHPLSDLKFLFDVDEERFPLTSFHNEDILSHLVKLGMHVKMIPVDILIDRCHSVSITARKCVRCATDRCKRILQYISKETVLRCLEENTEVTRQIKEIHMFTVMSKPNTWKFSWKSEEKNCDIEIIDGGSCKVHKCENITCTLCRARYLSCQNVADYVGLVKCILDENILECVPKGSVSRLMTLFGIDYDVNQISVTLLVSQTIEMVKQYRNVDQYSHMQRMHHKLFDFFESLTRNSEIWDINAPTVLTLNQHPVFLVGMELVSKEKVAFHLRENVKSMLYTFREGEKRTNIYRFLGVPEYFDVKDIVNAMSTLKNRWTQTDEDVKVIGDLLRNLEHVLKATKIDYAAASEFHEEIVAPDTHCNLFPTYELSVENTDLDFDVDIKILHQTIAPSTGAFLGVKPKELKCFEDISIGISFGQKEPLVTRIKGLLNAYPCDCSIMKELLQNADDAGASRIQFVKDFRTHPKDRIFSKSCESLQGPSLLVFNDSYFTDEDIKGLKHLGHGSKSTDPTKTGQYGVGFNAVYHLTDTPSVITIGPKGDVDSYMIVLDPLCRHVPKSTPNEPGQMCKLKDVKRNFPDQVTGFSLEHLLVSDVGTVFRFPLRQSKSIISQEVISNDFLDSLITSFKQVMFESVLFLKNVSAICVSNITSGKLETEYEVRVNLNEESYEIRQHFHERVKKVTTANKCAKEKNLDESPFDMTYNITVSDNKGLYQEWVISQQFGLDDCVLQNKKEIIQNLKERIQDGDIALLPLGGVAVPVHREIGCSQFCLDIDQKRASVGQNVAVTKSERLCDGKYRFSLFTGKAFCFLPLPIETGLPIHVNGHFALDHGARQNLGKGGYREEWNASIIQGIVVPTFISSLLLMQKIISLKVEAETSWTKIERLMEKYHILFLDSDKATSPFWRGVSTNFYTQILKKKDPIFPYILGRFDEIDKEHIRSESGNSKFCVHWTSVSTTSDNFGEGVFNIISTEKHVPNNKIEIITTSLKAFGMKLLDSPYRILVELDKIQMIASRSSPDFLLKFFHTWDTDVRFKCYFGPVDVHIGKTTLKTVTNLCILLKYLQFDSHFAGEIIGLPLMLTQDETLIVCSHNEPLISSEYSELLPSSSGRFLHSDLRSILDVNKLLQFDALTLMQFKDFVDMLPRSIDPDVYNTGTAVPLSAALGPGTMSLKWLVKFFRFLCIEGTNDCSKIQSLMKQLGGWSFLPCKDYETEPKLVPLEEYSHVIHLTASELKECVGKVLSKLRLPVLYSEIMHDECKALIEACVASPKAVILLLDCLNNYISNIQAIASMDDAVELLAFFNRNLENLPQYPTANKKVFQLKQLPLFPTLQNTLVSIENRKDILVVFPEIPGEGIDEWADGTNITLLQDIPSLRQLYAYMQLQKNSDMYDVYANIILPKINAMPKEFWVTHVKVLKDSINNEVNSKTKEDIFHQLRRLPFININGRMKKTSELYDPSNSVFKCMKDEHDFPPHNFLDDKWKPFLKKLGLITKVTDTDLLQFVTEVEREGRFGINKKLEEKSKQLLKCVAQSSWTQDTCNKIKTAKFVLPFKVEDKFTRVFSQPNTNDLICLNSAVSSDSAPLCWSCVSLLSKKDFESFDEIQRQYLGLCKEPSIESVILHCQNVVDAFKIMLPNEHFTSGFVEDQMTCLYDYLSRPQFSTSDLMFRLQKKPLVHLPDERKMVLINEIVIDLRPEDEIKPYLFRSPKYYGRYDKLFETIGSKKHVAFQHLADILCKLQMESKGSEMTPAEITIVKKVLECMLTLNLETDRSIDSVQKVYLPTEKRILKQSTDIVLSDEILFKKRLPETFDLDFLVNAFNFKSETDMKEFFLKWPYHLRPIFLSNIITETVCLAEEQCQILQNSVKAIKIKKFLHSQSLANCLCCLLNYQFSQKRTKRSRTDKTHCQIEMQKRLASIDVIETTTLKTILEYKGQHLLGTEKEISWHVHEEHNKFPSLVLYFTDRSREAEKIKVRPILPGLLKLIRSCFKEFSDKSSSRLVTVMYSLESGEDVLNVLEDLEISHSFDTDSQYEFFPKPGTYVEERLIPFLEQSIYPFEKDEFENVAMELEDSDVDENKIYIYVRISGVCSQKVSSSIRIKYIVETGNPNFFTEIIPIYRLYRFVRRSASPGQDLQIYDAEPIETKPMDDHCRRILADLKEAWKLPEEDRKRIIRRLLLKWHPDKNPKQYEYCQSVFQYIKGVIDMLENSEEISENVREVIKRANCHSAKSSDEFFGRVDKTGKKYAMAYRDNYKQYASSKRKGRYSHVTYTRTPHPDLGEARRWLRQSKRDFQTASASTEAISDVEGFNWICYMCHQACEKALKAVKYSKDAYDVPSQSWSHYLSYLTSDPELRQQINLLENKIGNHARMRYPDTQSRPKIPSDLYSKEDAEFSLDITRKVISIVEDGISQ